MMANELCTSLGLSGTDVSGKLVQIQEEHGSSASFVVSSLLWNTGMSQQTSLVLVALHHGVAHYHSVCNKLGFNLKTAQDNVKAVVLDPFQMFVSKDKSFANIDMSDESNIRAFFLALRQAVSSLSGNKCLIIDDLSGLISLGSSVPATVAFLQNCRALQQNDKGLSIVVCSHNSEDSEDLKMLSGWMSHVADLRITVAGLKTGFSSNVTGSIEVVDNLKDFNFTDKRFYHFKLTDRQIKVFAPGSVGIKN